jgi:hypothetical protein
MGPARRAAPLVVWFGALTTLIVLFQTLGQEPLAAPPLAASGWAPWLATRDPIVAAAAILRVVVLALAWYLLAATTIGLVARLQRSTRALRVADALTVTPLRQLLETSVGLTLVVGVVAAAVPVGVPTRGARPAVILAAAEPVEATNADGGDSGPGATSDHGAPGLPPHDEVEPPARPAPFQPVPLQLAEHLGVAPGTAGRFLRHLDAEPASDGEGGTRPAEEQAGAATDDLAGPRVPQVEEQQRAAEEREPAADADDPGTDRDVAVPQEPGRPESSATSRGPAAQGAAAERIGPVLPWARREAHTAPRSDADTDARQPAALEAAPSRAGAGCDPIATEHVVAPGESLWTIARDALAVELGRAPTEVELTPYWRELVAAHRPYLPDPDNADLIYPGDVVGLPSIRSSS